MSVRWRKLWPMQNAVAKISHDVMFWTATSNGADSTLQVLPWQQMV
jgi:hypothetical protein